MSEEPTQAPAAIEAPSMPSSTDYASLNELLAERGALCGQLSARQVEFAAMLKEQVGEIAELRKALAEASNSVRERYAEIAQLSKRVLHLEEAKAAAEAELASTSADARDRERSHTSEIEELRARQIALERDNANLLERERNHLKASARREDRLCFNERELVLASYEMAASKAELAGLHGTMGRQRELVSALRASLIRVQSSRAWRLGRALLRQSDLDIPVEGANSFDPIQFQKRLLNSSELFDSAWYLSTYPDAAESEMDPTEHYLRAGSFAGYNPGPSFDTVAYLHRYQDIRTSGMNPLVHFEEHGRAEKRDPGPRSEHEVSAENAREHLRAASGPVSEIPEQPCS